ncbi:MAG: hypothetical protein D6782_09350 [Alphaproteobacteria bacterium]|nr:MAG: hypothetical protein D6782_09350 [Alphaproteobacteria bacterium]
MVKRAVAAILGFSALGNGLWMLAGGRAWYGCIPGVAETGPYNPHFVADIGAAFCVAGLALIARAWRPRYWPAALAGAGFLAMHGLIHIAGLVGGHDAHALFELSAVVLPAALSLWAATSNKEPSHA